MKKYLIYTFLVLMSISSLSLKAQKEVIYCGDNKVKIVNVEDLKNGKTDLVWQWSIDDAKDHIPESFHKYFSTLDECKSVNGNKQILLTSSSNGVALIDRKSKKCLFYAYVPMAHSAELLPKGIIAVALSTHPKGNSVELFDINKPNETIFRDSLYSGHGVVWMKKQKRLYALGYDELREYSLNNRKGGNKSLTLENRFTIPLVGGHDLMKVNDNEILITAHKGVYIFDINSNKFSPFEPFKESENIKSVNYNKKTGAVVYTKAEISWWTHNIYIHNDEFKIVDNDLNIYKCRVSKW
ncbi:MAG: DUF6528 family protein [Bacteroidales bacterium]|nr:DUF6528 family protein [Bacteroidales bacterium]